MTLKRWPCPRGAKWTRDNPEEISQIQEPERPGQGFSYSYVHDGCYLTVWLDEEHWPDFCKWAGIDPVPGFWWEK